MQGLFYFFLFSICTGVLWFLLPFFIRKMQTLLLKLKCAQRRAIVLTFDDGPSQTLTPRLIDHLEQHAVRATFFVLGSRAEKNPAIISRLKQSKHVVGSHSYKHLNAWRSFPTANLKDIAQGMKVISSATDENKLFRPPFGKTTLLSLLFVFLKGARGYPSAFIQRNVEFLAQF